MSEGRCLSSRTGKRGRPDEQAKRYMLNCEALTGSVSPSGKPQVVFVMGVLLIGLKEFTEKVIMHRKSKRHEASIRDGKHYAL